MVHVGEMCLTSQQCYFGFSCQNLTSQKLNKIREYCTSSNHCERNSLCFNNTCTKLFSLPIKIIQIILYYVKMEEHIIIFV